MGETRLLTFHQVVLVLWMHGARVWQRGDRLELEAPDGVVTRELADAIKHYKPQLLDLVDSRPCTLQLPSDLYFRILWTPKPEWRCPQRVVH